MLAWLLAAAQPLPPAPLSAQPPGSLGWIENLAGSCFTDGSTSECFAMRDGRLVIISSSSKPDHAVRQECTLQAARDGALRFACVSQGRLRDAMVGRYRDGAFVTTRPSRSAAISWREHVETRWRLEAEDQLTISTALPEPHQGLATHPLPPPRTLRRIRR